MNRKTNRSITPGNVVLIAAQTSTLTDTVKVTLSTRGAFVRSVATKKTLPASTTTLIHHGMAVIGKKFAVIAAKPLTGVLPTARIRMAIGNTIRLLSIGATALAMTAVVAASISTVVIALRQNTMNITIRSTP